MMLRQKPMLGACLYRLGKGFCDAKHFHLTSCVLLRKIGSTKRTLPETESYTQTVAGEFHVQHTPSTNINNNFYGIEGDEGVIDVEQRSQNIKLKDNTLINQLNSKLNQEKVKKARFGTIRFDQENKPLFHDHFENNLNISSFKIDGRHKKINDEISDLHPPNSTENLVQLKHLPSVDSNGTSNRTQIHAQSRELKRTENVVAINKESFIDNLYFTSEVLGDKSSQKPVSDNPDHQKPQNYHTVSDEGGSFFDELYFSSEIADAKSNSNSIEKVSEVDQEILQNANLKDEGGFIEELYFRNEAVQSTNDEYSNLKHSTASDREKGFSFIDESYFDNNLIDKNTDPKEVSKEKGDFHVNTVENSSVVHNSKENIDFNDMNENYNAENEQKDAKRSTNDQLTFLQNDLKHANVSNFKTNFVHGSLSSGSHSLSENYNDHKRSLSPTEENFIPHAPNANAPPGHKHNVVKVKENITGNVLQRDHKSIVNNQENNQNNSNETLPETKREVDSSKENETAHEFVKKLRAERKQYQPLIKKGKILPTEEKQDSKGFRILSNQVPKLSYFTRDEIMTVLKNNVLYSDDDIVVLNKPYNLVIHESSTTKDPSLSQYLDELAVELDSQSKNPKLITVHRIDKDTCGCLILARNKASADRLVSLFAQRKIIKKYWIVTIAVPDPLEGVIDIPITEGSVDKKSRMVLHPKLPSDVPYKSHSKHGKRAVTYYKVISTSGNAALVEVQPETGIKHQIRVHFGFGLSCPILGDHKYSHLTKMIPQKLPSDMLQKLCVRQSKVRHIPMHIYARSITIPQYRDGRNFFVIAPMPTHISTNLQKLKFKNKK